MNLNNQLDYPSFYAFLVTFKKYYNKYSHFDYICASTLAFFMKVRRVIP